MSQTVSGVSGAIPVQPYSTATASVAGGSSFAALLATEESKLAAQSTATADAAAAEAAYQDTDAITASPGLDNSFLSSMLMGGMGGTSGGGMADMMLFILMFLFMNTGTGTDSLEGFDSDSRITYQDVQAGGKASDAFAAFSGEYGDIVNAALERLGDPYSQSKAGEDDYTDCSYLSRWCYRTIGVEIPRTAAAQAEYCDENGLAVTREELQPGDLIFYSLKTNGRYKNVSHVGIYAGNGMMIDASSNAGEVVYRPVFENGIVSYGRPR